MGEINVTYTPNYSGCHFIFIKKTGDIATYEYVDYTPSVIGEEKTTVIEITDEILEALELLDVPVCSALINIDLYVYPCCTDFEGAGDPINFDASVSKPCTTYDISCTRAGILSIQIDDPGSGYDPLSPPNITITAASGSGATATCTVNVSGEIETITIVTTGDGYSPLLPASITIDPPGAGVTALASILEYTPCGGVGGYITYDSCPNGELAQADAPKPGQKYNICTHKALPNLTNAGPYAAFVANPGVSCCECKIYRLSNLDKESITVLFTNCEGVLIRETILPFSAGVNPGYVDRCIVTGSAFTINNPGNLSIADLGINCE